jgi:CRISPR-associated endoribonuclease Cas6
MRIRLTLHHSDRQIFPIDYRYYLSAWIYKTIYRSDKKFATWLHDRGYDLGSKQFKLFCYSDLRQRGSKITRDRKGLIFSSGQVDWTLSFYVDETVRHFIKGVFKDQELEIAGAGHKASLQIGSVEILPSPSFQEKMTWRTTSPIFIKKVRPDGGVDHLSPVDDGYKDLLIHNLLSKYEAFHDRQVERDTIENMDFTLAPGKIGTKKHNVLIPGKRPIENKGYTYSFTLRAPVELQEVGYYAGFGNGNSSLGYGMVEVKNKENDN